MGTDTDHHKSQKPFDFQKHLTTAVIVIPCAIVWSVGIAMMAGALPSTLLLPMLVCMMIAGMIIGLRLFCLTQQCQLEKYGDAFGEENSPAQQICA